MGSIQSGGCLMVWVGSNIMIIRLEVLLAATLSLTFVIQGPCLHARALQDILDEKISGVRAAIRGGQHK